MDREINSPNEIVRRLIFIIYLAGWLSAVTISIIGLAQNRFYYMAIGILIGGLDIFLRGFGEKYLEFDRLSKSFPFGDKEDKIPTQLQDELLNIIHEFQDNSSNWIKRQELREKLTELSNQEPLILEAYGKQIYAVHPRLKEKRYRTTEQPD